jgi:hypothetical protein
MSTYKFVGKRENNTNDKTIEPAWSNDKAKTYLPPGQRKQTTEEAFPELKYNGLASIKTQSDDVNEKNVSLNFADRLKSISKNTTDGTNTKYSKSSDTVGLVMLPPRKTTFVSDHALWQSRRLYPSDKEEEDNKLIDEPEDDYNSFDDFSDIENEEHEVYDPSEYDRH